VKVADTDDSIVGQRIRVVAVAPSEYDRRIAPAQKVATDDERLTGQTGLVTGRSGDSRWAQLWVQWDDELPGTLMLADQDEIEVVRARAVRKADEDTEDPRRDPPHGHRRGGAR
jgi:hypothetical protein